jgi:streptogramin lyase
MRSRHLRRPTLLLLSALTLLAFAAAPASAAEPTVVELPTSTHATAVAPTADGTVWFSLYHGSEWEGSKGPTLGRLGADGTITEQPTSASGPPVLGPAGELWSSAVSRSAAGQEFFHLVELSSSGQALREYKVGRGRGGIGAMATTADAVWFVRYRYGGVTTIERLSTADGSVRQFSLRPKCGSAALAAAPGGSVWFAEACGHRGTDKHGPEGSTIGRILPSGKIVRHRITGSGNPVSIALGADGTVWFGMTNLGFTSALIGRITAGGALAEYRVPHAEPGSLVIGADGRVWFPSSFGGGIARALASIGPSGRPSPPICADPTCLLAPSALTAAPDGSLWYTLAEPHSIGGGGFTQIMEGETIENEAGFIGHLVP